MFNFKEELAKYRTSLEVRELAGGVSGDEVRDILDIAKELVNAREVKQTLKPEEAKTAEAKSGETKPEESASETVTDAAKENL